MADKKKRVHHGGEGEAEEKGETGGDLQAVLRLIMESNRLAEEDRRNERKEAERREEEREIRRAEAKAARKRDEAMALNELERQREEAAKIASESIRAQQLEAEERARVASEKREVQGEPVADRPAGDPLPVGGDEEYDRLAEEILADDSPAEDSLAEDEDFLGEGGLFCVRAKGDKQGELEIPPVRSGSSSRPELVRELKADPSLQDWREMADKKEQGFSWHENLLYQAVTTHTLEVVHLMVLPHKFRKKVMTLAHEGAGHLGARKVKALVRQRFVWPGMAKDLVLHCQSCEVCQMCKKSKARRVPLMERETLSEPFEVLAMDLVGPFPKGKGGYTYLLTSICMSSKWPEAIPLKTITAKAVAAGMIEIFARTGIPLQLLTDQGSQFVGSLVAHLCRDLHIDKVKTAPYHPECNGVVERMHGTLGAMLTKAAALGLDWVGQVPFALFALRSSPNRDTQFSPFQLVYGHNVRTPLDILHQGWAEMEFQELDTGEWSEWLVARLECWHDVLRERGKDASRKRKRSFDKGTVNRTLSEGDLVLCRVPGMTKKLKESWHGPYEVVKSMNRVDYKVKLGKGRSKILHINNLKKFHPRGEEVYRLAVVAEDWEEDECVGTRLRDSHPKFDREIVQKLKEEFPEVFSDLPGRTNVVSLEIKTGEAEPRASHPHRLPDKLKEGVRLEIEKLVELGVIVPSCSPWASPIVPVPKQDGTVRVCIDYRKLNEITVGDPYYMGTLEEILERVGSCQIMSKLDLAKGFYQVEVDSRSREKTAFICCFGKYEFTRMPFGLKNAPALFQRCMEGVLQSCYEFSAPYIDDVLVFSESVEEHEVHLRQVMQELSRCGLTVKESKCVFGMRKLEYLGHVIGGGELAVPEHRAEAMANYIRPKSKSQLRSFLGAAGYYRQFVPGFAKLTSVLSPSTSKVAPSVVEWTEEKLEAFKAIKVSLVNVCILTVPNLQDEFSLHTDASGAGIGATLNVNRGGESRPAAYYSRQLQGAQKRYSATELEGLAIFKSINNYAHYLFGRHFTVVTDHKALVSFLSSKRLNRRLQGWMLQLEQYDFKVIYRPGAENADADALSRQAWDSTVPDGQALKEDLDSRSQAVGGDVGISPTTEKKEEKEENIKHKEHCNMNGELV